MKTTLILILCAALCSCETMTPQTQAILAQGAVDALAIYAGRGARSGKATVPADGPDTAQKVDPVEGPNFGPP
jgi:hypothetical protein